jgi:hypothetical protein
MLENYIFQIVYHETILKVHTSPRTIVVHIYHYHQ